MPDRTRELEEKLAFQQRLLEELDEVVRDLNTRLARLEKQVVDLRATSRPEGDDISNERPPHYGGFGSAAGR